MYCNIKNKIYSSSESIERNCIKPTLSAQSAPKDGPLGTDAFLVFRLSETRGLTRLALGSDNRPRVSGFLFVECFFQIGRDFIPRRVFDSGSDIVNVGLYLRNLPPQQGPINRNLPAAKRECVDLLRKRWAIRFDFFEFSFINPYDSERETVLFILIVNLAYEFNFILFTVFGERMLAAKKFNRRNISVIGKGVFSIEKTRHYKRKDKQNNQRNFKYIHFSILRILRKCINYQWNGCCGEVAVVERNSTLVSTLSCVGFIGRPSSKFAIRRQIKNAISSVTFIVTLLFKIKNSLSIYVSAQFVSLLNMGPSLMLLCRNAMIARRPCKLR